MSADPSTAAVPGLELSCDKSRLDLDWCVMAMAEANHNPLLDPTRARLAIEHSFCIGAYEGGKQIGLIRFITDHAMVSNLTELFVDEAHRNKGVGTRLLDEAFRHPALLTTMCVLRARSHLWLFYFKNSDFHCIDKKNGIMVRQPR